MDFITAFAKDPRTAAVAFLILMDLITGVWAALSTHTFQGERLWQFLKTDGLAFIGYSAVYLLTAAGLLDGLRGLGLVGADVTDWGVFVIAVGSLLTSARKNVETATGWVLFPRGPHTPTP